MPGIKVKHQRIWCKMLLICEIAQNTSPRDCRPWTTTSSQPTVLGEKLVNVGQSVLRGVILHNFPHKIPLPWHHGLFQCRFQYFSWVFSNNVALNKSKANQINCSLIGAWLSEWSHKYIQLAQILKSGTSILTSTWTRSCFMGLDGSIGNSTAGNGLFHKKIAQNVEPYGICWNNK